VVGRKSEVLRSGNVPSVSAGPAPDEVSIADDILQLPAISNRFYKNKTKTKKKAREGHLVDQIQFQSRSRRNQPGLVGANPPLFFEPY
jgi:hypothetical protein